MIKGKGKRFVAMLLAAIMILGALPMSAFAAPASDIPSEMLDNKYLDALAYTGYKVQAQKDDGTIFKKYGYQLEGSSILSGITYDYTCNGLETTSAGKPDIAVFRANGLCCASYVSYVCFNYLPNVAGVDVSKVPRPSNYKSASGLSSAADGWVSAGLAAEFLLRRVRTAVILCRARKSPLVPWLFSNPFREVISPMSLCMPVTTTDSIF